MSEQYPIAGLTRRGFVKGALGLGAAAVLGGRLFASEHAAASRENVLFAHGQDPSACNIDGTIYYVTSQNGAICLASGESVRDLADTELEEIWRPDRAEFPMANIWAPKISVDEQGVNIYASNFHDFEANQRVFQLRASDPRGPYKHTGVIETGEDKWAIDGSSFKYEGKRYFVWSGKEVPAGRETQSIYIQAMSTRGHLQGERMMISTPEYWWEQGPHCGINEAPYAYQHDEDSPLVIDYSAGGYATRDYCLGRLVLEGNNPLDASQWHKSPSPVFYSSPNIVGVGSHSIVEDKNGLWLLYHNKTSSEYGDAREVRAQRIDTEDGLPLYGRPRDTF